MGQEKEVERDERTVDGRVPGRRGQQTRTRLLEVTVEMLREGSFRELAVVDIARVAGVSAGTFYQYFSDVESAILFIADHIADEGSERLTALVAAIDLDGDTHAGSMALAEGILDLWRDYESILRVLDLGAAERDDRFLERRVQMLSGPTESLRKAIAAQHDAGVLTHDIDPAATASVITSMLSHVAAHRRGLRDWGVAREDLVGAMARVITWSLTESAP